MSLWVLGDSFVLQSGPIWPRNGCWLGLKAAPPSLEVRYHSRRRMMAGLLLFSNACAIVLSFCSFVFNDMTWPDWISLTTVIATRCAVSPMWVNCICAADPIKSRHCMYSGAFLSMLLHPMIVTISDPTSTDQIPLVIARRATFCSIFIMAQVWVFGEASARSLLLAIPGHTSYLLKCCLLDDKIFSASSAHTMIGLMSGLAGAAPLLLLRQSWVAKRTFAKASNLPIVPADPMGGSSGIAAAVSVAPADGLVGHDSSHFNEDCAAQEESVLRVPCSSQEYDDLNQSVGHIAKDLLLDSGNEPTGCSLSEVQPVVVDQLPRLVSTLAMKEKTSAESRQAYDRADMRLHEPTLKVLCRSEKAHLFSVPLLTNEQDLYQAVIQGLVGHDYDLQCHIWLCSDTTMQILTDQKRHLIINCSAHVEIQFVDDSVHHAVENVSKDLTVCVWFLSGKLALKLHCAEEDGTTFCDIVRQVSLENNLPSQRICLQLNSEKLFESIRVSALSNKAGPCGVLDIQVIILAPRSSPYPKAGVTRFPLAPNILDDKSDSAETRHTIESRHTFDSAETMRTFERRHTFDPAEAR